MSILISDNAALTQGFVAYLRHLVDERRRASTESGERFPEAVHNVDI